MDDSVQLKLIREDLDAILEKLSTLELIEKRIRGMAQWVAFIGGTIFIMVGLSVCYILYGLFLRP